MIGTSLHCADPPADRQAVDVGQAEIERRSRPARRRAAWEMPCSPLPAMLTSWPSASSPSRSARSSERSSSTTRTWAISVRARASSATGKVKAKRAPPPGASPTRFVRREPRRTSWRSPGRARLVRRCRIGRSVSKMPRGPRAGHAGTLVGHRDTTCRSPRLAANGDRGCPPGGGGAALSRRFDQHLDDEHLVHFDVGQRRPGLRRRGRARRGSRFDRRRGPRRRAPRSEVGMRRNSSTPASIRVMSSRLFTSRVSRSVWTSISTMELVRVVCST